MLEFERSVSLERYDYEAILDVDVLTTEEVHVFANFPGREVALVALPSRKRSLQLNFRATDGAGQNLVVLPSHLEAPFLDHIFSMAIGFLRKHPHLPEALDPHVGPDWRRQFPGGWKKVVQQNDEVKTFFSALLAEATVDSPPAIHAVFLLLDQTQAQADRYYRPWVILRNESAAGPIDVRFTMVKYRTEQQLTYRWWERILNMLLGWTPLVHKLPRFLPYSSTHYRVRPQAGLIFARPFGLPWRVSRAAVWRTQAQIYVSAADSGASAHSRRKMQIRARITQLPSTRIVVTALLVAVSLLPLVLGGAPLPGTEPPDLQSSLRAIEPRHAFDSMVASLPLALALLGVAWERAAVRSFAVTQLVLALVISTTHIVASRSPEFHLWVTIAGLVLALYNLVEAGCSFLPLPKVE